MRAPSESTAYGEASDTPERRARWSGHAPSGWRSERARDIDSENMTSAYGGHAPPRASLGAAAAYPTHPARVDVTPGMPASMGYATALPARPYMPYTAPGA